MLIRTIAVAMLASAILIGHGPQATAAEWYQGGTLHQATIAQWHAATEQNRLATAADITAAALGIERLKAAGGMPAWERLSADLVTCVTKGTQDVQGIANSDMADYAAMCATMMGWLKQ